MTDVTWEERLKRVKMALSEVGYAEEAEECVLGPSDVSGETIFFSSKVPLAIVWQTAKVTGGREDDHIACWSCFEAGYSRLDRSIATDCLSGNCRNPGGLKDPPRDLLIRLTPSVE